MYEVVRIVIDHSEKKVECQKGLEIIDYEKDIQEFFEASLFAFSLKINFGEEAEYEMIEAPFRKKITYVNKVKPERHIRTLVLDIGKKEEKSEGCLVFIDCLKRAKTNGKFIIGFPNANAIILEEGQQISFDLGNKRKTITLIDGQLFMSMD